jgi:hypothetical protein
MTTILTVCGVKVFVSGGSFKFYLYDFEGVF